MSDRKVTKSMRLDEDLANEMKKICEVEYRSFSNMVEKILQEFVEEWKNKQKKDEL